MINRIFEQINYDIFGGELDTPIFKHTDLVDFYGFYYRDFGMDIIEINNDLTYFDGWCTLAHEMIHQWQKENNLKLNHKKAFKKKAKKIERFYKLKRGSI